MDNTRVEGLTGLDRRYVTPSKSAKFTYILSDTSSALGSLKDGLFKGGLKNVGRVVRMSLTVRWEGGVIVQVQDTCTHKVQTYALTLPLNVS